jgi:methionine-rich copper-binding protein CopC
LYSPVFLRAAAVAAQLFISFAAVAPRADAHAVIVDSAPAVDATVAPGGLDIRLHYNSRIDHQRSRLTLIDADGKSHPIPIVPDSAADVLAAQAADLAPGRYRLRWQVLAVDGHLTRGDIPFSVKAP